MILKQKQRKKISGIHNIIYMEVYGSNRIIYQVTSSTLNKSKDKKSVYGVSLKDLCTGESASISNFSNNLEKTVKFANLLVYKEIEPMGLYNAAFHRLSVELNTL